MGNRLKPVILLVLLTGLSLGAFAGKKKHTLPEWAMALAGEAESGDSQAGVLVLLDQTKVTATEEGFQVRRRVVKRVLRNWGTLWSSIYIIDGDEEATTIEQLKGWHQKANGHVAILDKENVFALGTSSIERVDNSSETYAFFERVAKGSLVVFESTETVKSYFPIHYVNVMGAEPILKREILFEGKGTLVTQGFDGWNLAVDKAGNNLVIKDIPEMRREPFKPRVAGHQPTVLIIADRTGDERLQSWDHFAKWYAGLFLEKALGGEGKATPVGDEDVVKQVVALAGGIKYRQRYLSSSRGYEPLSGGSVDDLKYGDCKDMSSFVTHQLEKRGGRAWPVLCSVSGGPVVTEQSSVLPWFNHAIVAVELSKSLALSSEVTVGGKTYLLYDPTDKYTPLGFLGGAFRDRWVLICSDQGALWAKVPEDALEEQSLEVDLRNGSINRDGFTLLADLELGEWGNAYGFRTMATSDDPWDMERHLRHVLALPALVDLQRKSVTVEGTTFKAAWRIRWPNFLIQDLDGLRLPASIVGYVLPDAASEQGRQSPIHLPADAPIVWRCNINSDVSLTPAVAEQSWESPYRSLTYKAKFKYKRLILSVARTSVEKLFPMAELEEGMNQWRAYKDANNQLVLRDAMLYR